MDDVPYLDLIPVGALSSAATLFDRLSRSALLPPNTPDRVSDKRKRAVSERVALFEASRPQLQFLEALGFGKRRLTAPSKSTVVGDTGIGFREKYTEGPIYMLVA